MHLKTEIALQGKKTNFWGEGVNWEIGIDITQYYIQKRELMRICGRARGTLLSTL